MNDPYIYGLLIVLFLLFSVLKSAFNSFNQLQLELDKKKEDYHKRILNLISKRIFEFKISVYLIYTFTIILILHNLDSDLLNYFTHYNHVAVTFGLIFFIGTIVLPCIEIIPSTIGEYFPNRIINYFSFFLVFFYILLFPLIKLIVLFSDTPIKILYKNKISETHKINFDIDDLNQLVSDSQKHYSEIPHTDSGIKLFQNALEFSEVRIRDCMVPRTEIVSVEMDDLNSELKNKFISTGLSRMIIYKDTIDNIVGYIKSNSLFSKEELKTNIKSLAIFPETMPANKLLRYFIRTGQSMVVVVDEFGGTSGIISIEDILEEIFGEIIDEHDKDDLIEKKLSDTDYIFSGRIEIDYINDKYNFQIVEDDEYETIAGLILHYTESIPQINQKIKIENLVFTILRVSNTRVELVKMEVSKD